MTAHALDRRATRRRGPVAVLVVAFLACFALLPVEIDQAFGLPAHPLLLHAPVIFNPILAVVSLAMVAKPAWRRRYGLAWGAFAVVALGSTVLAAGAGEAFIEGRPRIDDTLRNHADAAEALRLTMFILTALILAVVTIDALGLRAPGALAAVLSVLVVLMALTAGFFTVRAGHLGATAAWGEQDRGGGEGGPGPG